MRLKHGLPLMKKFGSHLRNSLVWLRVSTSFKTKKVVRFQRICLQAHNFELKRASVGQCCRTVYLEFMWLNAEIGSSAGDLTGNKNESSQRPGY